MFTFGSSSIRALTILKCSKQTTFVGTTVTITATINMDAPPPTTISSVVNEERPTIVSLQEWQAWGTHSPMPRQVSEIVQEMIVLEKQSDSQMKSGGLGGKLKVS